MAYTFANLKTDIRSYTEVDEYRFNGCYIVLQLLKMQKTEFIEKLPIMMIIDSMQLLLNHWKSVCNIPSDLRIIRYAQ